MGRGRARSRRLAAGCAAAGSIAAALWLTAGGRPAAGSTVARPAQPQRGAVAALISSSTADVGAACTGRFETIALDHVTTTEVQPAPLFDGNGSGVAADDLDGDGRTDIVLGNLAGPSTVLWNEGGWRFTTQRLADRNVRAVQTVDVDADGRLDVVTSHRGAGIVAWLNQGGRRFRRHALDGVLTPAYSMSWADVDTDGDLDLATGSYDAELDQTSRSNFLFSDGAGVVLYDRDGSRFRGTRLADASQALATMFGDLDRDGTPELLIGNDFDLEDAVWRRTAGAWQPTRPFPKVSKHTMSIDFGDINNDGTDEVFATDMKPLATDAATTARWLPLMAALTRKVSLTPTQRTANVLQALTADGFVDHADAARVEAAGWGWSGRFGDLDNDGDLDLYVVNGMIAAGTFSYLPGAELREANVAFRNSGRGVFGVESSWGLDAQASGRGSIIADLDNDGRLDIVVNNLASPALAFRNQTCAGDGVQVTLRQPGTGNTAAIGATLTVETNIGTIVREVRSNGGYLSGQASRLHVGLPDDATIHAASVRWPDGHTTELAELTVGMIVEVARQ